MGIDWSDSGPASDPVRLTLDIIRKEMEVALALVGVNDVADLDEQILLAVQNGTSADEVVDNLANEWNDLKAEFE